MDLFEEVFALSIDEETLRHRLKTRDNNDWGKQPHELKYSLDQHKLLEAAYKSAGFTMLDATKPVDKVVDEVLAKIEA
jgi:thymidylate kinase